MATLTLDGVDFTYPGGHRALDGVSLAAGEGEFLALVGPSGSGKTTLLRTVAGFLSPQRGTVRIGERTVDDGRSSVPTQHRRLGMVFQTHAIWPHWDVGRNVGYPLRLAKTSRAETRRRVAEALELVGLPGTEGRDPATLSGGQRQRVALARALVTSPDVLLLDEALGSLDEPLRAALRLEIKALTARAGQTVVHVTHDRAEALALADRVVIMREGHLEQVGAPAEVVARPATPFVAQFLGDATTVEGTLDGLLFRGGGVTALVGEVDVVGAGRHGTLAVLPADLQLEADDGGALAGQAGASSTDGGAAPGGRTGVTSTTSPPGRSPGLITASLYRADGHDVVLEWQGRTWRARVSGPVPAAGRAVRPRVRRATFFAETAP